MEYSAVYNSAFFVVIRYFPGGVIWVGSTRDIVSKMKDLAAVWYIIQSIMSVAQ